MSLVEFDDVSVTYRTQRRGETALDGVSLAIDRGSFVGISGPSEAGKSTLLRTMAGYVPNYYSCELDGQVTIGGSDVAETTIGELSATVGLLFENPFDQLTGVTTTVVEEVAYGLENQGLARDVILERTYDALEQVGIVELMERNPYDLSGGQSQRVALASILALEPQLLVLDEPTSQLDPNGTREVFDVIAEMASEAYTTVVVSQDMDRLAPLVDRLIILADGRMQADGTPRDVLSSEAADEGLFFVPDIITVGNRLRDSDRVDPNKPIPLHWEDTLEEIRAIGHLPRERSGVIDSPTVGPGGSSSKSRVEAPVIFEDVWFAYGDTVDALRGISLSLDDGCTCLIGRNGSGKSTFAKHLNGLLTPNRGRVTVKGHDTRDRRVAQLARDVGLSFQNPDTQLFHRTVAAEVRFGPKSLGYDEDRVDDLAEQAIELMGIEDVTGRNPYDLGQPGRKLVAIASVIAMDTDIIVLDEPTGGQDVAGTELIGDAVEALVDEGRTVLVITHDMSFVREHADRVIALGDGEVLLDGDPRIVLDSEDTLARTGVHPPDVTRIGDRLGLSKPVLTVDELLHSLT